VGEGHHEEAVAEDRSSLTLIPRRRLPPVTPVDAEQMGFTIINLIV